MRTFAAFIISLVVLINVLTLATDAYARKARTGYAQTQDYYINNNV